MKKKLLILNRFANSENTVESFVCFKMFLDFLERKAVVEKGLRSQFIRMVLDKLLSRPELIAGIPVPEIATEGYMETMELVSSIAVPLIENEEEALFGLVNGVSSEIFYASRAFHRVFDEQEVNEGGEQPWIDEENALLLHRQIQYDLILQKAYGYEIPQKREMVRGFFNPATGLYQYFRINIDTRFVEVTTKSATPNVNDYTISACFECNNSFDEMEKLIPISNFTAKGFSIITLTDITQQQAIEQLSKTIVSIGKEKSAGDFIHIVRLLQTMLGSNHYQFGLLPFLTVNGRAALLYENFPYSLLVKASWNKGIPKSVFTKYINHYMKSPRFINYNASDEKQELPEILQNALKESGIHYYIAAPVYYNNTLAGVLECGAAAGVPALNDTQFGRLQPVLPYMSQLMKVTIDKFNLAIDKIIKDKFTIIQSSVQWKFNEVAWHYFRSHDIEHSNSALEKISFKNVYPLYGAVDIRNSTIERNKVLREDLTLQIELLLGILAHAKENGIAETDSIADGCRLWLGRMTAYVTVEDELQFNEFLFSKAHPLLLQMPGAGDSLKGKIDAYFKATDELTGIVFSKRRQLDNSMHLLNKRIGNFFDVFKEGLQDYYPCYFEKFRTDGTEYDIYTGQSIAPKTPFSIDDVKKFRRWQVQSMADIAKLTHSLLPQLEHPLETTQLIFVNARTIDISFRNDERRFDAEGAYNIRYHIIKKRIDKVTLFNSTERLTQPGKIAIVFYHETDAQEYTGYINTLQQEGILLNDLEHLELENLQGVAGLKALRVGVSMALAGSDQPVVNQI